MSSACEALYEVRNRTAIITMNRPEKMNAWTPQMARDMAAGLSRANEDENVAAIVLAGAGKGFCAGADIDETFKKWGDGQQPGPEIGLHATGMPLGIDWLDMIGRSKPCIAAVDGPAVGVGLSQILPFDAIVTTAEAKFGLVFVKAGVVPELASSRFLIQRVGWGRANMLALTGRIIRGDLAVQMGLADVLAEKSTALQKALELADEISINPAPMVRMTKSLLFENALEQDLDLVQQRETASLRERWETPQHHEAVSAFLEKRKPDFSPKRSG